MGRRKRRLRPMRCDNRAMSTQPSTERSELSSVATQLHELSQRVGATGERLNQSPTEDAAASLFEMERALRSAARALDRAMRQLR